MLSRKNWNFVYIVSDTCQLQSALRKGVRLLLNENQRLRENTRELNENKGTKFLFKKSKIAWKEVFCKELGLSPVHWSESESSLIMILLFLGFADFGLSVLVSWRMLNLKEQPLYRHRNDPHHRNDLRHRNDPQSPPKWSPPPKWYLFAIEMIPS